LVRSSQKDVPFITFGAVTFRFDLITALYLENASVVVSTTGFLPEVIKFSSDESAKQAFNEIMSSLGMGETSTADDQGENLQAQDEPKPKKTKKPPDKVPRKAAPA
jgi:hypothetical protein